MFEDADIIHAYTRADALDDGTLIDGRRAELADVTDQHAPGVPVAMTAAVWKVIQLAVAHPLHRNDYRGVWHDILWMAQVRRAFAGSYTGEQLDAGIRRSFRVIITGTGRKKYHDMLATLGFGDDPTPVITIAFAGED